MAIIERNVLRLRQGKWDDFVDHAKRWRVLAEKHGFSLTTPSRYDTGVHPWGTIVIQYHWDSMTEREAKWGRFWADPETQALGEQFDQIYESFHREMLRTIGEFE
jgi:hypothetical protein